ncbi:MAG TPA: DoxX family protein [Pseudolabrys sp.]|nr:DoxX family protein [Pseudolabrys sp.]
MVESKSESRLLFPALAGFYASWNDISYTLLRVGAGGILFVHGWGKITGAGLSGVSGYMAKLGLAPGFFFGGSAIVLETIGALCVLFGLFTRFFAAALAIEMLIAILTVHLAKGFGVGAGGYEYVLLLGIVLFAIAIRGGGPYSIDAKLGKEL